MDNLGRDTEKDTYRVLPKPFWGFEIVSLVLGGVESHSLIIIVNIEWAVSSRAVGPVPLLPQFLGLVSFIGI